MSKKNFMISQKSLLLTLGWSVMCLYSLPILPSRAGNILRPSDAPLELHLLTKPKRSVVTGNTINRQGLTIPSLWWAKKNAENKLLDNWIVYPGSENESARVDLIVNQQIWSVLDYLERYRFVNNLGNYTRGFGYNIRIFNYQKELLATYTCNLDLKPELCNIQMSNKGKLSLPIDN